MSTMEPKYQHPSYTGVARPISEKLKEVVSVKDFGAVGDGVTDDYPAFAAALAAASRVIVPSGTYKVGTQIDITGDKTITGPDGGTQAAQSAVINFTGVSGNVFSATSAEFGGVCIKNLSIVGGNGAYAIRSSRPQSLFENILMEGYVGSGIELFEAGTGSQASWGCTIRNCKWVGPASPTAYRGYQIDINGGHVTLENCAAIRGAIGINIDQGEAINIIRCSINAQIPAYSSSAAVDTCSIRLSGSGYKKAISIRNSYIESYRHGIYVEKCESLSIEDNYIADVGSNSNYASIYLKDANVNNVTIRNNSINDSGNSSASIDIGNGVVNAIIENNYIDALGNASIGIRKGTTTYSYTANNKIAVDGTGYITVDPNSLLIDTADRSQLKLAGPASTNGDTRWVIRVSDTSAVAANNGGGVLFQGVYTGSTLVDAASVQAYKLNASAGDYGYGLRFVCRANGGNLQSYADLSPTGFALAGDFLSGTSNYSGTVGAGFKVLSGRPIAVNAASTNGTTIYEAYSTGAGAYRFYVGMGGTVYATNTTISAISDQRFKENIRDLNVGLIEILALKPRVFDWKEGKGKCIKNDRGFIAQEFEQVFPDLIDEWKDQAPEGEEPYKSVRADLIPVLVKAIQELKAENDVLKARLDAAGL